MKPEPGDKVTAPLLYADDFFKEPDRAVVVGLRWFNHSDTVLRAEFLISSFGRYPDWGATKAKLRKQLEALMQQEGIKAERMARGVLDVDASR